MLNDALGFLSSELSNYLQLVGLVEEGDPAVVEVSKMADREGNVLFDNLGVVLTNIEEDRIGKAQLPYAMAADGTMARVNPEIKLNLYVLVAANFGETASSALIYLGHVIDFFQMKQVFTPANSPTLPDGVEKLIVEMITLTFEQQNHLWGTLGTKYLPSVLYKVRMLVVQNTPLAEIGTVDIVETNQNALL